MAKKVKAKFDWKKTAWKFGKSAIYIFLAGLASVYGQSAWYLALVPVLVAVENYLKHR